MKLGTGPLRGWAFSPGPRAEREKTLRGAFLQALIYQAAGDEAAEHRLLSWRPDQDSPDLAELLAEALTARRDELAERFAPLVKPTPAELEELQRRSVRRQVATLCAVRIEEEGLGFHVPPDEDRATVAQLPAALDEVVPGGEELPSSGDPPATYRVSFQEEVDCHFTPEAESAARLTLWESLRRRAAELGPSLWRTLADNGPIVLVVPQMCCVCAQDVVGECLRMQEASSELCHFAHPACVQAELERLAARLEAQKPSGPPPGLCPTAVDRWRKAHDARELKPKPKTYRGDTRVGCELCSKAVQRGQSAVPKRSGSSKIMHASCRDQVLANPNTPPTPPTATESDK